MSAVADFYQALPLLEELAGRLPVVGEPIELLLKLTEQIVGTIIDAQERDQARLAAEAAVLAPARARMAKAYQEASNKAGHET